MKLMEKITYYLIIIFIIVMVSPIFLLELTGPQIFILMPIGVLGTLFSVELNQYINFKK